MFLLMPNNYTIVHAFHLFHRSTYEMQNIKTIVLHVDINKLHAIINILHVGINKVAYYHKYFTC